MQQDLEVEVAPIYGRGGWEHAAESGQNMLLVGLLRRLTGGELAGHAMGNYV